MVKKRKPAIQLHTEGWIDDAAKAAAKAVKVGSKKLNPKNSYALGKKVVHGSPVQGLKKIEPMLGSAARKSEKVVYGWSTKSKHLGGLENNAREYAKNGSIYVGRVPRSGIVKDVNKGIVVSQKPIKVTKEIKISEKNVQKKLEKAVGKKPVSKIKNKVVAKKRQAQYRRANRNSPV